MMERLAQAVAHNEPVLLIGETGTGKTRTIQNLSTSCNAKLHVIVRTYRNPFVVKWLTGVLEHESTKRQR